MTGYLGLLWMCSTLKGHSINKMSNMVYSHTQRGNRTFLLLLLFLGGLLNSVMTLKMGHGQWNNYESVSQQSLVPWKCEAEWWLLSWKLVLTASSKTEESWDFCQVQKHVNYLPLWYCMMMSWCLMSSDVIWHIRDKLWPMPKHGSIKSTYVRCMRV